MMHARRRTFREFTLPANIAAGASVTLPPVEVPSIPFLDEVATPAEWRKVTLMCAGQELAGLGSTAANWSYAVTITFQPTKNGPSAQFPLPVAVLATNTSQLAFTFDTIALPGMSFQVVATLAGGAPAASRCRFSYGAAAVPSWVDQAGPRLRVPNLDG